MENKRENVTSTVVTRFLMVCFCLLPFLVFLPVPELFEHATEDLDLPVLELRPVKLRDLVRGLSRGKKKAFG